MRKEFAEALDDLIAAYADEDSEKLITELELKLMALREEAEE